MPASQDAAPAFVLVVVHPFNEYQKGDHITDPKLIAEILNGEHARSVVKTAA